MRCARADPSTSASATLDHQSDMFAKPTIGQRPRSLIRCDQAIRHVSFAVLILHFFVVMSVKTVGVCLQAPSPDGSAVLENSEQFQVHLKAAIMDPRVKEYAGQPYTHHVILLCSAAA